jgi:hypothetical protein
MSLYVWRVIIFLYAESGRHSCNLTDMRWKASACIGLRVGMVPESYHHLYCYRRCFRLFCLRLRYVTVFSQLSQDMELLSAGTICMETDRVGDAGGKGGNLKKSRPSQDLHRLNSNK